MPQEITVSKTYTFNRQVGLKLIGTAVADDLEMSMAIIEIEGTLGQDYFKEGQCVGGVRIKQILRNRVIVDYGQKEVNVAMMRSLPPQAESAYALTTAIADTDSADKTNREAAHSVNEASQPYVASAGGRSQFVHVERADIEWSLPNIDQALQEIEVHPVMVYGRPAVIRVNALSAGSIFNDLGISSRDVIVGVNGQEISRPDQALELLQKIRQGGEVTIQVKGARRNRILQLDIG